jgi:hypothetical protein
MEKKNKEENYGSARYIINKQDIMPFVEGLRAMQEEMIEAVVSSKQSQGFPEASAVIDHIRCLK